jgi:phosphoglycolate phosphatase-like HAD superfamily hydrolase
LILRERRVRGHVAREFLDRFHIPVALPEYSRMLHVAWSENARAGVAAPVPYVGVTQLLRDLRAAGHRLFLVSCCWQDVLDTEVQRLGWGGLFERVVGDLVSKRDAIAALRPDLYIGDTVGDLRACEGLTRFVAVGYGYGPREQFAAAGVGDIVASSQELPVAVARALQFPL